MCWQEKLLVSGTVFFWC
uniref:Uncharacterized protein n=1 Tax=Arundo donax TaxID=35708 RepID=A0A0A9BS93_ARUDO